VLLEGVPPPWSVKGKGGLLSPPVDHPTGYAAELKSKGRSTEPAGNDGGGGADGEPETTTVATAGSVARLMESTVTTTPAPSTM
jgi:hypothetical protein